MQYISKIIIFLKEVKSELKKVHWPSRKEALNHTFMVIGISGVIAVILGGLDFMFTYLMNRFIL